MEVAYGRHRCAEIEPGLLCGGWGALKHISALSVTHVLSVFNLELHGLVGDVDHLHISVQDVEQANLLVFLEQAHLYIDEALQAAKGRVLVHCYAGMSRSVSVTVSYLMKKNDLSLKEALTYMSERYPNAAPNPGFLDQLECFHECGYDYQRALASFQSRAQGLWNRLNGEVTITRYHPKSSPEQDDQSIQQCKKKELVDFVFECRKCHTSLGDSTSVHNLMHVNILQESGSMFVEHLDWMQQQTAKNKVSGKLYCPGCKEKIGSFNWSGLKDDIMWHVPAFQLHLSKLDIRSASLQLETIVHEPKLIPAQPAESDGNAEFFDYFVFDCDGVLVNTEVSSCESLYLCIRDVTQFEIPHNFPDDFYEVFGMDVPSCLEHYKKKYNLEWNDMDAITQKALASKEEHYSRLTSEKGISAFDGVVDLITRLRAQHIPYGVASSGHPKKIKRNLQESGLDQLFDPATVVSAVEVEKGKPSPDVYLEAFDRVGCRDCPEKCLVIEDSVSGLIAAKSAGAFSVGITNSLPRSLLQSHADLVVDHISELAKFIHP